jgi:hypothetical protein
MISREYFNTRCRPRRRDGCIRWRGKLTLDGYGRIKSRGHVFQAHRVALLLAGVNIPPGHVVHHTCKHKWCVATPHLEVLPRAEHRRRHRAYVNGDAQRRAAVAPVIVCGEGRTERRSTLAVVNVA